MHKNVELVVLLEIIAHRSMCLHGILFPSVRFQIMSTLNLEFPEREEKKKKNRTQNSNFGKVRTSLNLFSTFTQCLNLKTQRHTISKGKRNFSVDTRVHLQTIF